jgi:hypothetical protein
MCKVKKKKKKEQKKKNIPDLPLFAANMSIIRPGVQTIISAPLFNSAI